MSGGIGVCGVSQLPVRLSGFRRASPCGAPPPSVGSCRLAAASGEALGRFLHQEDQVPVVLSFAPSATFRLVRFKANGSAPLRTQGTGVGDWQVDPEASVVDPERFQVVGVIHHAMRG